MLPDYGVDKYDIGSAFGHFGIAVDDVSKTVKLTPFEISRFLHIMCCSVRVKWSFRDNLFWVFAGCQDC